MFWQTSMFLLLFHPGCQQSEAARVSASLQALWFASNTPGRGSEGNMHTSQLWLRLLHPLPGGFPRFNPLQSGAAPTSPLLLQVDPTHTRQRSQQEERQAPVTEQNWDFNHRLFLTGWITFYGPARVSLAPTKVWTLSIDVWLGSCLCTVAKRDWTLALPKWINWLRHFFKHYWDNQPEGVIWLKPLSSVSDKHRMPEENNADEKALNCTVLLSFKMRWM